MWRDMEADAIMIGLDLHYYWSLNPKQWAKHIEVFNKKEQSRLREQDLLNHILGKYIAYAFNDPKKYPDKPFLEKNTDLKPMTDEEMERQARHNTIRMGGVIK
ncbi:MAG: hypothetical protein IKW46_07490 [Bacteroidaceae bacterium]|nr:hypothetical protein [Bacteroidaceae bacterium]